MMRGIRSLIYSFTCIVLVSTNDCELRKAKYGSVCVCNSTYCDTVPEIRDLKSGQYQLYTTSKAKLGFNSTVGTFSNSSNSLSTATVRVADLKKIHQKIVGFGGAFTDSTGINIARLPVAAQKLLLESYFGDNGIQYSLGRVPIGGTDFSTRPYTYCDKKDETLNGFALQVEDIKYKIPLIQKALELRGNKAFRLFASAWSAPKWMKTNNWYNGAGTVKDEYWSLWAKYYIKFFDAYLQNNIRFWGVTTQNEPQNGIMGYDVQNVGFTPFQMVTWITEHLGPIIRNSTYKNIKIILHDDQRMLLPILQLFVLSNDEVVKYSDGIGVHWYTDDSIPASILDGLGSDTKYLFRLGTEACEGYLHSQGKGEAVELGNWERAESYLDSIFDDLRYDFVGWTDWNMALNETGGPNWINNIVDSPIIVNGTSGEFYKQPMFYVMGHFSKFLEPDSVRIDVDVIEQTDSITSLAFKRPDGKIAVLLRNRSKKHLDVKVDILGTTEVFTLAPYSMNTLLYSI